MHKVGRFLFPTTSWGNEVGSQVAVYPTLAREAFCGDAPQAFLVFRSSGLFGSSDVFCVQHSLFPLYAALSWIFAPAQEKALLDQFHRSGSFFSLGY
jgi:hypothetical protein